MQVFCHFIPLPTNGWSQFAKYWSATFIVWMSNLFQLGNSLEPCTICTFQKRHQISVDYDQNWKKSQFIGLNFPIFGPISFYVKKSCAICTLQEKHWISVVFISLLWHCLWCISIKGPLTTIWNISLYRTIFDSFPSPCDFQETICENTE